MSSHVNGFGDEWTKFDAYSASFEAGHVFRDVACRRQLITFGDALAATRRG